MLRSLFLSIVLSTAVSLTATAQAPASTGSETVSGTASVSRQVNDGPENEISASFGTLTILQIVYGFAGIFGTAFSAGLVRMDDLRGYGAINLSYYRSVNKWLSLGTDLAAEHISLGFVDKNSETTSYNSTTAISPMLSAKGNWLRRNHFGLYSHLSAGAMFVFGSEDEGVQVLFAPQVSPLGMEFGGVAIRGFVELGFGAQGIALGGLKYRF